MAVAGALFSSDHSPRSFNRADVEWVTHAIEGMTENGIRSADGKVREVDVGVLASGDAANKHLSVIDVAGRNGNEGRSSVEGHDHDAVSPFSCTPGRTRTMAPA